MITDAVTDPLEIRAGATATGRAILTTPKRYPSMAGALNAGGGSGYTSWRLPAATVFPIYFGYGLYPISGSAVADSTGMVLGTVGYQDPADSTTGGSNSCPAVLTANRGVAVFQRTGAFLYTLLSVSDPCMHAGGGWHWIEGCIALTKGSGNATQTTIQVDGVTVIDQSGTVYDPLAAAQAPYTRFSIGSSVLAYATGAAQFFPFTDFYLCDSAGSAPYNTYLGEIEIECRRPTGDSPTWVQWTCSSGVNHWALVDETTPNDDTDYVSAITNKKDGYTFPALVNAAGTVLAVQMNSAGRLLDPYADHYQDGIVRRAGADGLVSALAVPHNRFTPRNLFSRCILTSDPTDSSAWTIAKVNAAEFGPRRA